MSNNTQLETIRINNIDQINATHRDNTLDIVAGILIIRMIFGHYMVMCHLKDSILYESLNLLFFYMPWFFYKSGMFCSSNRKNTQQYLISNTKKFIIPYIFFSVAGTLIALITAIPLDKSLLQIILNECRSVIFTGSTNFNGPLWFLLTLFFVRVSFNYVRNLINHYILIAILLIIAFAHYLLQIMAYGG